MRLDLNKSIIFVEEWQSNMAGRGLHADKSAVGLYNEFSVLEGVNIDPQLWTSSNLRLTAYNSNLYSDFLTNATNPFNAHSGSGPTGISMGFSFYVRLMQYLAGESYTKNVIVLKNALGGTSIREINDDVDWGNPRKLAYESNNRVKHAIEQELRENGNESQVITLMVGGESETANVHTLIDRLHNFYDYKKRIFGVEPIIFAGQIMNGNNTKLAIHEIIAQFNALHPDNFFYVGQGLVNSTWYQMELDDPTGSIIATNPISMTTAGDQTHYNWKAQILQGLQLWDLFTLKMLT